MIANNEGANRQAVANQYRYSALKIEDAIS